MRPLLPLVLAVLAFASPLALSQSPAAARPADPRFEIPATDAGLPGEGPLRRYEWFRNAWRERRSLWSTQVAQDQGAVVFLGDSITQGWGDRLATHFPGLKFANRGIGGDTTRGLLLRLDEDVLALNPAGVVLLIGTNDLEEQAHPWTIAANLRQLLGRLKAHNPKLPVVLCQVMPSADAKRRPAYKIKRLNVLLREAVKDQPQVTLVDTWTLFANPQGDANPAEFPDLLHLNDAGYAKWAAALRPVLETLGFLAVPADDFSPEPGFVSLFNGRDLTGWETWLGRPHQSLEVPGLARGADGRYSEPIGLGRDPFAVFTVIALDGAPALRFSGQVFGTISSVESFSNYHLRLQFKWGTARWAPRADRVRDSGLLYHGHGPHGGGTGSAWINSHELQIQEKDCGDYWAVGPVQADIPARPAGEKLFQYDPAASLLDFGVGTPHGNRVIKLSDHEKPHGEWNTIELYCVGDEAIHVVNGQVVLRVRGLRTAAGERLTSGCLQLQSEGAEVFYRAIEIRPLTTLPPALR